MKLSHVVGSVSIALASLTLGGSAFGQDTQTARSEYDRLRANCGSVCNSVPARSNNVSCLDWTTLAGGLSTAAANQSATCGTLAQDAVTVLDHASTLCGALTGHAAQLQRDLTACRNPQRSARRLVSLPVCLSQPQYGGAVLVCRTRNGHELRGDACRQVPREQISRAGCACPVGAQPTWLANTRGAFCAMVVGANPPGVAATGIDELERRVAALATDLQVLTSRVDDICRHAPPSAAVAMTDDANGSTTTTTVTAASVDCAEMNQLIMQRFLQASGNGGSIDMNELNPRFAALEVSIGRERTRNDAQDVILADHTRQLAVRNSAAFRFVLGVEAGTGVYEGLSPMYALIGMQARARVTPGFHLYGEGGMLAGSYGAAQVSSITGYFAGGGVGGEFAVGPTTLNLDIGFAMRSYASTGISTAINADAVGVFGDYRGRVFGGQLALSAMLYRGLGLSGTLFVGTGDAVVGTDVPGNFAGVGGDTSFLGSARLFYQF